MSRKRRDRSSTNESKQAFAPLDAIDAMLLKAQRLRTKGEVRKAFVALRHAVNLDESRARSWALYAAMAGRLGQVDEAARAFEQARWLNARSGFGKRAAICQRLAAGSMRAAA